MFLTGLTLSFHGCRVISERKLIHRPKNLPGMPTYPDLYADDLIAVLKHKHATGSYKSMVTSTFIQYLSSGHTCIYSFIYDNISGVLLGSL